MLVTLYRDTLFVIENTRPSNFPFRKSLKPSTWFMNEQGMILTTRSFSNGLMLPDLTDAMNYMDYHINAQDTIAIIGMLLTYEGDICAIESVEVDAVIKRDKKLKIKKSARALIPICSRFARLKYKTPFTFVVRSMANQPSGGFELCDMDLPVHEYIRKTIDRSTTAGEYGEYAVMHSISLDNLQLALQLGKDEKFDEIDALWDTGFTREITLTDVTVEELKPFTWENIQAL